MANAVPPYCDLVMKGGITSGVVYPPVACKLAEVYRFRNIGGTSAGAIAAAATAAAELGFRKGNANVYDRLADLPNEVAGSHLLQLFRPDPSTRALFRFLLAMARARGVAGKILVGLLAVARATNWWLWLALLAWLVAWTAVVLVAARDLLSVPVLLAAVAWGLLGLALLGAGVPVVGWSVNVARAAAGSIARTPSVRRKIKSAWRALVGEPSWHWLLALAWLAGWIAAARSVIGGQLNAAVWTLTIILNMVGTGILLILQGACLLRGAVAALPANFYGLCTGCAPAPQPRSIARVYQRVKERTPEAEYPSLTRWLYELFNDLAGIPMERPLVFSDLWTAPKVPADFVINGKLIDEKVINLEVMTTDLTRGRPYRAPFELSPAPPSATSSPCPPVERSYLYFCEDEWRRLFPEPVIDWLTEHADRSADPVQPVTRPDGANERLVPLPQPSDLPVVVAARLSLSFPLLMSAVPLYAIDKTLPDNTAAPYRAERVWFSDGGISSNFPVHFFDDPLPRWPTFGINLVAPRPDGDITPWMAGPSTQDWLQYWDRFGSGVTPGPVSGFLLAIFQTMQNWRDNLQVRVPGYWDRVVHIPLRKNEGGLNLTMSKTAIGELAKRGARAGVVLRATFKWTNHAWVRYRSTMAALEDFLRQFDDAYRHPIEPADDEAWALIAGRSSTPPPSHPWIGGQATWAPSATQGLLSLVSAWTESGQRFQECAPAPPPELRVDPRVSATLAER